MECILQDYSHSLEKLYCGFRLQIPHPNQGHLTAILIRAQFQWEMFEKGVCGGGVRVWVGVAGGVGGERIKAEG